MGGPPPGPLPWIRHWYLRSWAVQFIRPIVFILSVSEYEALDLELDQLNSCLDKLENWNDSLQSRMKDMLETMQKTRVERQPQNNQNGSDTDTQRPQDAN